MRDRTLDLGTPVVMGVLNVTPDSFSDGGRFRERDAALAQARRMIAEGAAIIDVGRRIDAARRRTRRRSTKNCRRVIPVIESLRPNPPVFISIDTSKPAVMRAAVRRRRRHHQ